MTGIKGILKRRSLSLDVVDIFYNTIINKKERERKDDKTIRSEA